MADHGYLIFIRYDEHTGEGGPLKSRTTGWWMTRAHVCYQLWSSKSGISISFRTHQGYDYYCLADDFYLCVVQTTCLPPNNTRMMTDSRPPRHWLLVAWSIRWQVKGNHVSPESDVNSSRHGEPLQLGKFDLHPAVFHVMQKNGVYWSAMLLLYIDYNQLRW